MNAVLVINRDLLDPFDGTKSAANFPMSAYNEDFAVLATCRNPKGSYHCLFGFPIFSILESTSTSRYRELASTGWAVSRGDIRRDVQNLFLRLRLFCLEVPILFVKALLKGLPILFLSPSGYYNFPRL